MRELTISAPVRTADVGGWTDTWFARTGTVTNIAVGPGTTVRVRENDALAPGMVCLRTAHGVVTARAANPPEGDDRLLWSVIQAVPVAVGIDVDVSASVPPGSGLGTSASVVVALAHALYVIDPIRASLTRQGEELVATAHAIESSTGTQTGVQDHCAAVFGGIRRYRFAYPKLLSVEEVPDPDSTLRHELDRRLHTVYLGAPHSSSRMHERVIAKLESVDCGALLEPLRAAADAAFAALCDKDLDTFGAVLRATNEATRSLDDSLIGHEASRMIDIVRRNGAIGWKVNGAGGTGGSMCVLGPDDEDENQRLRDAIDAVDGAIRLPLQVSAALRMESSDSP